MRQKSYKQIEASRNTRLWLTTVVMPVATTAIMAGTALYNGNLEFRYKVNSALHDAGVWLDKTFHKNK